MRTGAPPANAKGGPAPRQRRNGAWHVRYDPLSGFGGSRGLTSAGSERNVDTAALQFGPLFRRPGLPAQIERAVDQTDMTIGLRKIAKHAAGQRIELLSKQSHVIAA